MTVPKEARDRIASPGTQGPGGDRWLLPSQAGPWGRPMTPREGHAVGSGAAVLTAGPPFGPEGAHRGSFGVSGKGSHQVNLVSRS